MRFVDVHFVKLANSVSRIQRLNTILLDFLSRLLKHLALNYLFDCGHAATPSHITRRVLAGMVVGFRKLISNLAQIPHAIWESNGVKERIRVLSGHIR
jgi:hypothetical protein